MDKKKRLNKVFEYLRFNGVVKTQIDMASLMGASRSNISSALSGKTDVLTDSFLERVSKTFGINYIWLLTGEGEMLKPSHTTITQTNVNGNNNYIGGNGTINNSSTPASAEESPEIAEVVPVVPRSIYTEPNVDILKYCTENDVQMTPKIHQLSTYDLCYMVVNDEMSPYINPGDRIFLLAYPQGKERKVIDGRVYAVDTKLNGVLTRQLYKTEGGFLAKAYNNKYGAEEIEMDDIYRVYRIVGLLRMDD